MDTALYFDTLNPDLLHRGLSGWRASAPQCGVLALLAEADAMHVSILQQAASVAGIPLVGAIFPALLHAGEFAKHGVWLLCLNPMPPHALIADLNQSAMPADAILAELEQTLGEGDAPTTLLLFCDAMLANIGSILETLYLRLADRVSYMGANAGSKTFQPMACLFDDQRVVANGVLGLLLPDAHGAVLEHGYLPPAELISATATEGNRILSIDWRPAFEVYQESVRSLYGVELTRENFYQYAVHFPFGILLANGDVLVRIPVALEADGSLFCVGEVPPNSMLTLLQAPAVDSRHTVEQLDASLRAQFGPCDGRDLLTFYCAGRRLHLAQAAQPELADLLDRSQCGRLIGALSLGEIGSLKQGGYPMFHNATLVCRPW
jgi:hypothetical protein